MCEINKLQRLVQTAALNQDEPSLVTFVLSNNFNKPRGKYQLISGDGTTTADTRVCESSDVTSYLSIVVST